MTQYMRHMHSISRDSITAINKILDAFPPSWRHFVLNFSKMVPYIWQKEPHKPLPKRHMYILFPLWTTQKLVTSYISTKSSASSHIPNLDLFRNLLCCIMVELFQSLNLIKGMIYQIEITLNICLSLKR